MSDDPNYNPIRNVILPDAKKQPDRSLAIVLAAVVEDQLGEMLRAKVVDDRKTIEKMFAGMGPLATFSAQIDLGFLLGFYGDEMHKLLHAIRVIRNTFAHEMRPLDFSSNEIITMMRPFDFINAFAPHQPRVGRELYIAGCEFCLGATYAIRSDGRRFRKPARGQAPTGAIS